jgi:hypothetical protein
MPKFIHFGCWNKGGCYVDNPSKGWNDLSSVMRNLREVSESNDKPDFIVVAGDNYYPENKKDKTTGKKIKKIVTSDLMSGLECLPENIPTHILLGNHDVESGVPVDNKKTPQPETKCYILDKEEEFARSRRGMASLNTYNSRLFDEKTLVLMIDTTIYSDNEKIGLPCYRHMYDNQELTLKDLRDDQMHYIESLVAYMPPTIKNLVIIGHYPITGYKVKRGEAELIANPGYNFVKVLYESVYEKIKSSRRNKINYYYLCADLHQYQIGNIQIFGKSGLPMNIKQYIVGTGGTTLDPYPFSQHGRYAMREIEMQEYKVRYLMTPEEIELSGSRHGFLECYSINGKLEFKFIDLHANEFVEEMYSNIRRSSIGGKKIKKPRYTKPILKGGGFLGTINLSATMTHEGQIDDERILQNETLISLLSTFQEYKDGLIYISFGSAHSGDEATNAADHLFPSFLLFNSLQRQRMDACKRSKCKILCIAIDGFNETQLRENKNIINNRIKHQAKTDFMIINIKELLELFQGLRGIKTIQENERFTYTLLNKIGRSLQDFEINPMNVMIANYVKFRSPTEKETLLENAIPQVFIRALDPLGYGSSCYDWMGYTLGNSVKSIIYNTKLVTEEKYKLLFNVFFQKFSQLISKKQIRTLFDLTPTIMPPLVFSILKFMYPLSQVPSEVTLKHSDVTNHFTYSLSNFLNKDTRSIASQNQISIGGSIRKNKKNKTRKNTKKIFNNRTRSHKKYKK